MSGRLGRGIALWTAVVLAYWFGLVVPWMPPEGTKGDDLHGYFFPKYVLASELGGWTHWPLWNPYELLGVPLLGVSQPAALYPPRAMLFALLPPDWALHAFVVVHYLLLGAGCFVLAKALRIGGAGAWMMALLVATQPMLLTAANAPHWIASFAWAPFALAAAVRLGETPGPASVLLLVVAMTMQLFAGYPEYVFDTSVALAVVWTITLAMTARREGRPAVWRAAIGLGAAAMVTVLLGAPQLCAFVEAYRESVRAAVEFPQSPIEILRSGGASLRAILGLFFTIPPPVALGLGLAVSVRGAAHRAPLLGLLVLCVAGLTVFQQVPPFSMSRSSVLCWGTLAHLAVGGLAAIGFDRLLATPPWKRGRDVWPVLAAAVVGFALYGAPARLGLALSLAAIAALAALDRAAARYAAIAVLLALVVIRSPSPASVQRRFVYPSFAVSVARGERIARGCDIAAGGRVVAPEETFDGVLPIAKVPSPQAYPESLSPRRTMRLLDAAGLGMTWTHRIDWNRVTTNPALLGLLDVRCVVAPPWLGARLTTLGFTPGPVVTDDGRIAFRGMGRAARLVGRSAPASDAAMLETVTQPAFEPDRLVMTAGGTATDGEGGNVEAIGNRLAGRHAYRTTSDGAAYLVVSESWYPGWRARIDGRSAAVTRVDYALLGVRLPPGTHTVELLYRPRGFGIAVALLALGVPSVLALAWAAWRARARA